MNARWGILRHSAPVVRLTSNRALSLSDASHKELSPGDGAPLPSLSRSEDAELWNGDVRIRRSKVSRGWLVRGKAWARHPRPVRG